MGNLRQIIEATQMNEAFTLQGVNDVGLGHVDFWISLLLFVITLV